MGGIAFRAPVLADALPDRRARDAGDARAPSNFVGEFLILLGVFKAKLVIAIIAFSGVVMASVYALRLFIRAMHNRVGAGVDSREITLLRRRRARAARRGDPVLRALPAARAAAQRRLGQRRGRAGAPGAGEHLGAGRGQPAPALHPRSPRRESDSMSPLATAHLKGPHVDFAALSPLIALLGGAVVVLLVGLLGSRRVREQVVPALSLVALGAARGPDDLAVERAEVDRLGRAADRRPVARAEPRAGRRRAPPRCCSRGARWRAREAAHGEFHALLLTSIAGMSLLAAAQNTVALFIGLELLSIPLYVLCATEMRREHSLESGLKYLIIGSVGSATLLYGLALIYGATGATDFGAIAAAIAGDGLSGNVLLLTGIALCVGGPVLQGLGRALSPVDPRRLRGRADAGHGVHGGRHQGRRARRVPAPLRRRADRRPARAGDRRSRRSRRSRSSSATSARSGSPR